MTGIRINQDGDVRLGTPRKVKKNCWQAHLPIGRLRPMVDDNKIPDMFVWRDANGTDHLSRDTRLGRPNCLVHVNTCAGEASVANGSVSGVIGFSQTIAGGLGSVGLNGTSVVYQDAIVEMAPGALIKVTGTNGKKYAVRYDGGIVTTEAWDEAKHDLPKRPTLPVHKAIIVQETPSAITALGPVFDNAVAA